MDPLKFLKSKEKEIIYFLRQLVQIPSQNGIDSEKKIAQFVFHKLKSFGLKPRLVGGSSRPSIILSLGKGKKKLWLDAHLDTVSVGERDKWRHPPFSGKISNGKLYGRGAGDCKASVAIFSYIALTLLKAKQKLKGELIISFDSDEESGNFGGIKEILGKIKKINACILGYAGMDDIMVGSRGFLRLKIETFGRASHTGSRGKKGVNAISKMAKVISALEQLKLKYKKIKFFEFGPKITISQISGGRADNVVPDYCRINIDVRLIPLQKKEEVIKEIESVLDELKKQDSKLKFEISSYLHQPAFLTSENSEIVKLLKRNAEEVLQRKIVLRAAGSSNVGNLIALKNKIPICVYGVKGKNIHSENEYIFINTVLPAAKIYLKTISDFLK